MAVTISTPEIAAVTPEIIAQETLGKLINDCPLIKTITLDSSMEKSRGGLKVKIGKRGGLVRNEKLANTATTLQNPSMTAAEVTMKPWEVTFSMEDITKTVAGVDYLDVGYVADAVGTLQEGIESDIAALFTDVGLAEVGTGLAEVTEDNVLAARAALTQLKAPQADRFAALSTRQTTAALKIDRFSRYDAYGKDGVIANGALKNIAGFNVVESPFIPFTTGGGATEKGAFYHRQGIALATRGMSTYAPAGSGVAMTMVEVNGMIFRVSMGYVIGLQSTQITIDCLYGVGFLRKDLVIRLKTLNT